MHRIVLLILACITLSLGGCGDSSHTTVTFPDGSAVRCIIAATPEAQRAGLTVRDSLAENEGMIFVYTTEREYGASFWMPNKMQFRIDILFLDAEKRINMIHRNVPICESNNELDCPSYTTSQPTQYVIEVVAGFCDKRGLKIGDSVDFEL